MNERRERSVWATWANLLTLVRTACVLPCAWAVLTGRWGAAAAIFSIAVVTDLLDGPLARRHGHASALGGLLDHGTDALFVSATLAALAVSGHVTFWLPVLVAAAFLQYMADSSALAGRRLRASFLGRNNGIAYFVLAGIPIARNALGLDWPPDGWIRLLGWLLVATTAISMIDRAVAFIRSR